MLLELLPDNLQDMINGFLFKICSLNEFLLINIQNASCCIATNGLQLIKNPVIDFICKFFEVDIFDIYFAIPVYIYFKTAQFASEFDVVTTLTNGQ